MTRDGGELLNRNPSKIRSCHAAKGDPGVEGLMLCLPPPTRVFLILGTTEMRNAINSFSLLVDGDTEIGRGGGFHAPPPCLVNHGPSTDHNSSRGKDQAPSKPVGWNRSLLRHSLIPLCALCGSCRIGSKFPSSCHSSRSNRLRMRL